MWLVSLRVSCLLSQLEQKCFSQQEQLESLQEQQAEEQERSQRRISELETRVDQVGGEVWGRGGGEVWRVVISVPTKLTFAQTSTSRMPHLNECGSGFKHLSVGTLIM